jgi:hypothetical protein
MVIEISDPTTYQQTGKRGDPKCEIQRKNRGAV